MKELIVTDKNHTVALSKLALKGSSKTVSDFFEFSLNSLLYQRGLYPPEDFQIVKKYGLQIYITTNDELKEYIRTIMQQVHKWIYRGNITKLVVPIINVDEDDVVERWVFNIEIRDEKDNRIEETAPENAAVKEPITNVSGTSKSAATQKQIQHLIRQITSSVTFLPILEGPHTFTVLVYTSNGDQTIKIPNRWIDTNGDGKEIVIDSNDQLTESTRKEEIKFRSFNTDNHNVDTFVSYKYSDL